MTIELSLASGAPGAAPSPFLAVALAAGAALPPGLAQLDAALHTISAERARLDSLRRTQRPAFEVRREPAQELGAFGSRIKQRIDADDARFAPIEIAHRHGLRALARRHHHYDATAARERADRRGKPASGGVDDHVPAAGWRLTVLEGSANSAVGVRTAQSRELQGRRAHPSGSADDVDLAAFADARTLEQLPGGHVRHAARRRLVE
jgi:hypothetical protein